MPAPSTATDGMPVLPVEAYTSQDWFDREQRAIFSRTWACAGLVEDLAEPGRHICVQAGLNNIFVIKGRDGELRAFHNMCRHRGTRLLRPAGRIGKAITCPYHDWTYDLDGRLISVPEEKREFAGIDKSSLGLRPAAVEIWRGMIWVHPDPDAEPLVHWFGKIEPKLGPHRVEELIEAPDERTRHEIKANWKIVAENFIDQYHLSHLHSGTLAMYDHAKAEFGFVGPHYAFREPLSEAYARDIEKNAPLPLIDHIPRDQLAAWVPLLFPGIGLTESETTWSLFHIKPVSPGLTVVETRTKVANASEWDFTRQAWRSAGFWKDRIRGKYPATGNAAPDDPMLSGDFMAEDIYVCEMQQAALQSPHFSVGPSAVHGEAPVRAHQEIVRDYVLADPA